MSQVTGSLSKEFFLLDDIVKNIALHLPVQQLGAVSLVCRTWHRLVENDEFWIFLMTQKGLPFVEGIHDGYRKVFFNLYSRTISGEMIKECFGEVRDIPKLSQERYAFFLTEYDPFIPAPVPQQKIHRTFFLVINPAYVYRVYEKELFDKLDASEHQEDKPEICLSGKEMKIPLTARNRELLIKYLDPDCKIFNVFLSKALFCHSPSKETTLCLMREHGVYQKHTYTEQKRLIEEKGYQLAPLDIRFISNIIWIRKTGTCPDKLERSIWTFTRTGNTVRKYDKICPISIGGAGQTISIDSDFGEANEEYPALPCLPC